MAELPTAIDKRNMLWAPEHRKPFDALAIGDGYLEAGRHSEALDFFERVKDAATRADRFSRVKKEAVAAGSAFLIGRLSGKGLIAVSKDDWSQVAKAARANGQLRYALRAAIQADDTALATELRAQLGDAVPQALAARAEVAESPEQAHAGATHPGQKVEAVAAAGAAHSHEPHTPPTLAPPAAATNGAGSNGSEAGGSPSSPGKV